MTPYTLISTDYEVGDGRVVITIDVYPAGWPEPHRLQIAAPPADPEQFAFIQTYADKYEEDLGPYTPPVDDPPIEEPPVEEPPVEDPGGVVVVVDDPPFEEPFDQ